MRYQPRTRTDLEAFLSRFRGCAVGVVGDFCLDAYWMLSEENVEQSIETGKSTQAIRSQRYAPGGAGNIAANLAALGLNRVLAFGVVGNDLFGRELVRLLERTGVSCAGLVTQDEFWDTAVYAKPYLDREEQERIDFGRFNRMAPETEEQLIGLVEEAAAQVEVFVINQQIVSGVCSDSFIERLNEIASEQDLCRFVADARHVSRQFRSMVVKLNAAEALRYVESDLTAEKVRSNEQLADIARGIQDHTGQPAVITNGERGIVVAGADGTAIIPGVQVFGEIDTVGAGDTVTAVLAAGLAAGLPIASAAEIANLAAAVTVRKLEQTGTASPREILDRAETAEYLHRPYLAANPSRAKHLPSTRIEIVNRRADRGRIRHLVFDHDGTISTLRQGWETIMEPMMVRCILGSSYMDAPDQTFEHVTSHVRRYIDRSTGLQTILQMHALRDMVLEFGFESRDAVLSPTGYKKIYSQALLDMVAVRTKQVQVRKKPDDEFMIEGVRAFLNALRDRGVHLYLASGTDEQDVHREARLLGYADVFDGGMFGALGDISKYSKKMVIERIMQENELRGPELACFGDGPVEIRETARRGGITIGVASDEVRRSGVNPVKRTRLINAGADIIVGDYTEGERLLEYLFE